MGLNELIESRNDILFAEIGALIHDLGKLSKEFVEEKSEEGNYENFEHYLIVQQIKAHFINRQSNYYSNFDFQGIFPDVNFQQPKEYYHLDCLMKLLQFKNEMKNSNILQKIEEIIQKAKNDFLNRRFVQNFNQSYIDNSSLPQNIKEKIKRKLPKFKNFRKLEINLFYIAEQASDILKNFSLLSMLNSIILLIPNKFLSEIFPKLQESHLEDFIGLHHRIFKKRRDLSPDLKPYPIHFLDASKGGADGVDSAIDKMVAENCEYVKQRKNYIYIATAFGYEKRKIDLEKLTTIREHYADILYEILASLKDDSSIPNWIKKRKKLFQETRKAFVQALGETRRPANDVTLWDHSFSVASLYKAALAEIIINKWKDPKEIKWKLLSIRFDGNTFYNAVPKIGNVLGRKELVKKVLDAVKDFLEVVIPIGNEIYRDENGSVFLVPECANENGIFDLEEIWEKIENIKLNLSLNFKGEWEDKELKEIIKSSGTLRELIENIASFVSEGTFVPEIRLSKASRGALNMGEEISKIGFPRVNYEILQKEWKNKKEGYERCSVCGLKPIPLTYEEYITLSKKIKQQEWENLSEDEKKKYKAYERKVCLFCLKLAQDRVRVWWSNDKWDDKNPERPSRNTSIWLDEIADENNRVALVYLSFDLSKWLNGEMLNTFLSKPLLNETLRNNIGEKLKEKLYNITQYNQLISLLEEAFNLNDFTKELSVSKKNGEKLKVKEIFLDVLGCYIKDEQNPEELFNSLIVSYEPVSYEPEWEDKYSPSPGANSGDNTYKASVFLLHLTRKHPSFARIRRIWETTKEFSIMCFKEILSFLPKRNRLVFKFSSSFEPAITHTYWIKIRNKFYEVAIVEEDTAVVINKFENVDFLKEILENLSEEVGIYLEPSEGKEIGKINIVKTSIDLSNEYFPAIPFMFEPTSCLFFVPLNKAWEIVKFVKEQYEIHFNKVQDKLPLKLGFVAFHKRMPMYAVLDAVKRMMKFSKNGKSDEKSNEKEKPNKKSKEIEVIVKDIEECPVEENCKLFEGKIGNKVKKLTLDFGKGKEFTYYVSYSTGDPEKEDIFHPYFIVKDQTNGWQTFVERKWQTIKHVSELKKDDKISFYPSYFDFLWLDTNTRRYDAGEDRKHWVFKNKSPKPYFLKEIEHFERLKELLKKLNLTSSQIFNAYEVLMNKILEWELDEEELPLKDKIFEEFVEGVIFNVPLRLKKSKETSAGKISEEDYKFLKNSVLSGLFFDFIDLWHTILKRKFEEEKK